MFSFRTTPLDQQEDMVLRGGRLGVLCNYTAWNPQKGEYLFESLAANGNVKKVLCPRGDFGNHEAMGMEGCEFVSLKYPLECAEGEMPVTEQMLEGLDALIVEYQDTGSRFDQMTAILFDIFQLIHHRSLGISIYILDRDNMGGRMVEGTALVPESESVRGIEGVAHRHGLTLGELSNLFYSEIGAKFPLHIISYMVRSVTQYMMPWSIPAYEDVPGLFTSAFYCGMKLLEGTNLSYGIGTMRPYEMVGAPFMDRYMREDLSAFEDPGVYIRKCGFTPASGIYAGQLCSGFQMLPVPGEHYHSVAHALRIIAKVYADCPSELDIRGLGNMLGDDMMLAYVRGEVSWKDIKEHIKVEEQKWIRKARRHMLYEAQLVRVKSLI